MGFADPFVIARDVVADIYPPRERVPVDRWCERHRRMATTGAAGARSGRWDTALTPYLRQIFRNLTDPAIHEISVQKSSQIGFSELLIGAVLHLMGERRQPGLVGYPTQDEARDFNRKRLIPALHACDATAGLITSARDTTETEIRLGGVPLWFSWAHSKKTFKSDPCGFIFLDEIDEYPPGGSILSNARDRQRTFTDRKLIKGSTPEEGETPGFIVSEYAAAGHRHRFLVPCPITGEFFELFDFANLKWEGGRDADPDAAARRCWLQSPFVRVPKGSDSTAGRIPERHKPWMVRNGVWVRQGEEIETTDRWREHIGQTDSPDQANPDQTNPDQTGIPDLSTIDADELREPARAGRLARVLAAREPDERTRAAASAVRIVGGADGAAGRIPAASHVGYRINALASLIDAQGWGGIVRKGLKENLGHEWQKGTLGQAPAVKGDIADIAHLRDRCTPASEGGYAIGTVPEGVAPVSLCVDVQKYCVYAGAVAFGDPGTDPALVGAVRIDRQESRRLTDIDGHLLGMRFTIDGHPARPAWIGVDCGAWDQDVYDLVARLRGERADAIAMRGESGQQTDKLTRVTIAEEKDDYGRPTGVTHRVLRFHTDRWMTRLYGLIADAPEDQDGFETLAEPRRLRLPEPWMTETPRTMSATGDFLRQITAEKRVTRNGVTRWELRREGMDNHYGDTMRMCLALGYHKGVEMLVPEMVERLRRGVAGTGPIGKGRSRQAAGQQDRTPDRTPDRPGRDRPRHAPVHSPGAIAKRHFGG